MEKIKIAFVCTGNTCRSPMAQFILKQKLKTHGFDNVLVYSFGLNVTEKTINDNAIKTLKILNVNRTKFIPKQLNKPEIFDAIITMTREQKKYIKSSKSNVYSIAELSSVGDITDPYGKNLQEYINVAVQIDSACNDIINLLGRL